MKLITCKNCRTEFWGEDEDKGEYCEGCEIEMEQEETAYNDQVERELEETFKE